MFWWRIRDQVQNALKDLEMFVALAEKHDVDKVMTKKTLEPIVNVLLYHTFPEPNQQRALIAELFVNTGLEYLKKNSDVGTLSNERTINEAINLAEYLVSHLKEEVEEEEEDSVEI